MQIDAPLLKEMRNQKGWTQHQLADITGLSLRTIQRLEKTGSASTESFNALCACFEIEREMLLLVPRINPQNLRPVQKRGSPILLVLAMIVGGVLGSLLTLLMGSLI